MPVLSLYCSISTSIEHETYFIYANMVFKLWVSCSLSFRRDVLLEFGSHPQALNIVKIFWRCSFIYSRAGTGWKATRFIPAICAYYNPPMDLLLNFHFNVTSACGLSNFYIDQDIYWCFLTQICSYFFSLCGKKMIH